VAAGSRSLAGIAGWAADLPRWTGPRLGSDADRRACPRSVGSCCGWTPTCWTRCCTPGWPRSHRHHRSRRRFGRWRSTARPAAARNGRTAAGCTLFSIVDHATGIPLGQVLAETKGHEIAAFATVLDRIDLANVVVTADALHTQKAHARYLHRHGGRYVFIVKRNQPTLHAQLTALPWQHVPVADHAQDKGHARRESRTLQLVSINTGIGFPHARLAARITRTRTHAASGATSRETVYAVTNLDWAPRHRRRTR
jgi:predicted transposase YbfD/YdcC